MLRGQLKKHNVLKQTLFQISQYIIGG